LSLGLAVWFWSNPSANTNWEVIMGKPVRFVILIIVLLLLLVGAVLATPLVFLRLGKQAFAQSDYLNALMHYERATTTALIPSAQAQALWGRGLTQLKQHAYAPAVADFTAFLSLEPNSSEAYAQRGYAHLQLKHYDDAVSDLTIFLSRDSSTNEAYAQRGEAHLQLKHYTEAIADFTAFIQHDATRGEMFARRGYAQLQLKQWDEAIDDLRQAVALKSPSLDADKANLAEAYYRRAQQHSGALRANYQAALSDLTQALFADATRAEIHTLRSSVNVELKRWNDAIGDATQAIQLDDHVWSAYAYRGFAQAQRGQWLDALSDATRVIRASAVETRALTFAYFARATAYHATEKYKEAIGDATQGLNAKTLNDAHTARLYVVRALSYVELESYKEAVADFTAAEALKPDDDLLKRIYAGNGWAYLWLEDYRRAIDEFTVAIKLSPRDAWLYLHRGLAWAELENYILALRDYDEAQRLDPQRPMVYTNRGIAYAARGDYDKALADFEKAITLSDDKDFQNWNQAHALLARATSHSRQARQASKELETLWEQVSKANRTQKAKQFQANYQAMRKQLQAIEEQVSLMAQQYGQIEKLNLPEWYKAYAAKSRQSLELMVEGFQLTGQVWAKSNTLATVLPRLSEQLDKAAASPLMGSDATKRYSDAVDREDFNAARQLTAQMRDEFTQYRDYFQRAQRESGLGFVADAVQFFEQQIAFANVLDQLADAVAKRDRSRYDQAFNQLQTIDAELTRLGKRMDDWDTELTRWLQRNVQPLVERAAAKFEEAQTLAKEASTLFEEKRHSIIIRTPRRIYPPSPET
jgi:tetratricopeptide (TPR) repeat protein